MTDALPKLKFSRFRHVYAKSVRRSEWYDTGPGHGLAVAANPKMIALAIDVPAGGIVQVAKLCTMGRGHMEMGKIKDHEGPVYDVKWNPFNDNVLATGSDDSTVRVWHISDDLMIRRRVHTVEWHTTVDNAIFSASLEGRVALWNIETDELIYLLEDCNVVSISFSYNCSEFAITTKTRELIIFDARTGEKERSTEVVHDGSMLSRVLFMGTSSTFERLITTGNSRNTRRQIAVYRSHPLDVPLALVDVDGGSGMLMPIIDNDLHLLYVAGKGDANIRFYELIDESPYISYLNESTGTKAHTAVCALPKRGLNVSLCEIMRIYRVDAEQLVIEPLSFIVPRRADCFQADLFPPTRSPTPSLTFREWFAGLNREPIMFDLKDCILNCTNKPVAFAKESSNRTKLIIADVNNDKKFRFLSQVTKPDYRKVTDRDDCEELLKLERIAKKLAAEAAMKDLLDSNSSINGKHEDRSDDARSEVINETALPADVIVLNQKNSSLSPLVADSPRNHSLHSTKSTNGMLSPSDRSKENINGQQYFVESLESIVKPSQQHNAQKRNNLSGSSKRNSVHVQNGGNARTRSCFSEEALVNVIRSMDKELCECRSQCENLEKVVCLQQRDIDSLRYEIHWKDARIKFLQTQLKELDSGRAASSQSS